MGRLATNKIKVMVRCTGQCTLTVPKQIADAMELRKGDVVSFQWLSNDRFLVYKNDGGR